jgi:3-hydroxy-9,10-secoandrosta-1,3,5(10)-triene-9,17-dione monooxygenase
MTASSVGARPGTLAVEARALIPALRDRGDLTEQLRQLTPETVADLNRLNVIGTSVPVRFGGLGLDLDEAYRATVELAKGDGSTGWVAGNTALHNMFVGYFSAECQEDVWGRTSQPPFVGNGFNMARSTCQPVKGGYRISGRWDFATATMHADWHIATAAAPDGPRFFAVHKDDYRVIDTWDTIGMRGTGSHDVVMDDVFVPETHSVLLSDMFDGTSPGGPLQESPMYRVPTVSFGPGAAVCTLLGIGYGAVELFDERCRTVPGGNSAVLGADRPDMAMRSAAAAAQLDAVAALFWSDLAELKDYGRRDVPVPDADRLRYRRDHAYCADAAARAVAQLFEAAGATALQTSNALGRAFRDSTAGSHHYTLARDTVYLAYGRSKFGLDPNYVLW